MNYEDRHTTMEAPDDQDEVSYKYLRNITIPAAFLTKTDGQALKDLLKKGKDAYVSLDWTDVLPKREVVEWEFWSNSNDQCGAVCDVQKEFVKEFVPAARQLEGNWTKFTPHYIVWVCPSAYRVRSRVERREVFFLSFFFRVLVFSSTLVSLDAQELFPHQKKNEKKNSSPPSLFFFFFLSPPTHTTGLRRVPRPVHPRRPLLHPRPGRGPPRGLLRRRHRRGKPQAALRVQARGRRGQALGLVGLRHALRGAVHDGVEAVRGRLRRARVRRRRGPRVVFSRGAARLRRGRAQGRGQPDARVRDGQTARRRGRGRGLHPADHQDQREAVPRAAGLRRRFDRDLRGFPHRRPQALDLLRRVVRGRLPCRVRRGTGLWGQQGRKDGLPQQGRWRWGLRVRVRAGLFVAQGPRRRRGVPQHQRVRVGVARGP